MSDTWSYENLGTADDLIVDGFITATAFYQTIRAKCFDLLATDEVWIKFDVYFDSSTCYLFLDGNLICSKAHTCSAKNYTHIEPMVIWHDCFCRQWQ